MPPHRLQFVICPRHGRPHLDRGSLARLFRMKLMGAMSKSDVLNFYGSLDVRHGGERFPAFRSFLEQLLNNRSLDGCTFFTSHWTLSIVRFPTYSEWRFKPQLSLDCPFPDSVRIQLQIYKTITPAFRITTEESNAPYSLALDEFDQLYAQFLDAHRQLQ